MKIFRIFISTLIIYIFTYLFPAAKVHSEEIGSVNTEFKIIGPNHKIVIEAFDDPNIKNITCYISRAKTGGIKGELGFAEDNSDASISCHQIGPVKISDEITQGKTQGKVVFHKRTSLAFKHLQVVRFFDQKRNILIYLIYTNRMLEGSPKNSLSTVPIAK